MKTKSFVISVAIISGIGIGLSKISKTPVPVFASPDAIEISNVLDLKNIENAPDATYVLSADIDLNGESWIYFDFSGTLYGNGFSIMNLNKNYELFRNNYGTIDGVTFINTICSYSNGGTITGCSFDYSYSGNSFVTSFGAACINNASLIDDCSFNLDLDITLSSSYNRVYAGSIVHTNGEDGIISNCNITGSFENTYTDESSTPQAHIGGLACYNNGTITGCNSSLGILARGVQSSPCGGVSAYNEGNISYCVVDADIAARIMNIYGTPVVGGITAGSGTVSHCFTSGSVSSAQAFNVGDKSVAYGIGGANVNYSSSSVTLSGISYFGINGNATGSENNLYSGSSNCYCYPSNYYDYIHSVSKKGYEASPSSYPEDNFDSNVWNFKTLLNSLPQLCILNLDRNHGEASYSCSFAYGSAKANGSNYESGQVVSDVGNYIFSFEFGSYSYIESVIVDPIINGVLDGETYYGSVSAAITGGTPYLDDSDYVSGTSISIPGDHILRIDGINGYSQQISFTVEPTITNLVDGESYNSSVTPEISGGTFTLDGNTYLSGTTISEPGDHILVISGVNSYSKTINFTINLVDSGIEDGDVFVDSASYTFSGGSATLDGESYASGTAITEIGNHTIVVSGSTGFEKTIHFAIGPSISGVTDGLTYNSSVTPVISGGTLTLDDNAYSSGTTITIPGDHSLVITGVNGYSKTISFTISLVDEGIVNNGTYYDAATYTFSGGSATLDGESYASGTAITEIGNHTIVVTGIGEFSKTINFTIEPTISNLTDGVTYETSVTPLISGGTITLDGYAYSSGTEINEPGSHVIKIVGVNDYSKTINFSISLTDSGIEDGDVFVDSASYTFSGGSATLDGESYASGTAITEIGNHTIVVIGASGYSKTISFVIKPSISGVEDGATYDSSAIPVISGGSLTLDGEDYESGTKITIPGDHVLVISGVNEYSLTLSFTIALSDSGIVNDGKYEDSATYTFSGGSATLDGESYASGTAITEIGNHTIVVTGIGEFSKTINFTIEPTISNISDGVTYDSSVTPEISGGKITLDDKDFESGTEISEPGDHKIVITGVNDYSKTINFSINLVDSGISDGNSFVDSASYTFSGGSATLDGKSYASGTEITEIGNHTIVVSGSTGFSKTISFVIEPSIEGILDGGSYDSSVTPVISGGTLTLDGESYTSGTEITIPGSHELVITGTNNYKKTVSFSIGLIDSGISDNGIYYESVSYTFSGGSATLDGESYASGTEITGIGKHTIIVTGIGQFKKTINFEIKAIQYSIESDDYSWSINISECHPDTVVKVDGNVISGLYSETSIGNHTLTITNKNGYEESVTFTIKEQVEFKDGETSNEPIVIDDIEGDVYVDGVKVNPGYRIDQNGTHTITIVGANGYKVTYKVTYHNPNYNYAAYIAAPSGVAIAIVVFMIIKRRRIL